MHLDEYTVLDLTQLLPGAYTTQLLADLGATVLKVEPPDGDPLRSVPLVEPDDGVFDGLSRETKCHAGFETDEGQEALHSIVTDVDVVIEGIAPAWRRVSVLTRRRFDRSHRTSSTVRSPGSDSPGRTATDRATT